MTWRQVQAEALRLVNNVAMRRTDLELTEYHDEARYRSDHPGRLLMRDPNAIVRAATREASRRGIFCLRRTVR